MCGPKHPVTDKEMGHYMRWQTACKEIERAETLSRLTGTTNRAGTELSS